MASTTSASRVVPGGCYDTSGNEKHTILVQGWVLDSPLDAERVKQGWIKLCDLWPILSSRLRKSASTKAWEFHIPTSFSSSSPAYDFRYVKRSGPIARSYNYNKPTDSISLRIKENPDDLYSSQNRRSVAQLMAQDIPISQLSLTNFDDAAVVGLSIPHVLSDGHGAKEVMRALAAILRGEDVAPVGQDDPLLRYCADPGTNTAQAKTVSPPTPPGWRVFSALQMLLFILNYVWDTVKAPKLENRELYFPPHEAKRIKQQAMDDIKSLGAKEKGDGESWISTSDALLAFMLKCLYTPAYASKRGTLSVMYAANMRNHLPSAFPPIYLGNAARGVIVTLPVSSVPSLSLGALALLCRRTLQAQTSPAAAEDYVRWRLAPANAGKTTAFFNPNDYWNVVTNWRDMRLMHIDFSGGAAEKGTQVKCVYLWGTGYQPMPMRHCFGIVTDDLEGGVWTGGFFPRHIWEDREGFGRFVS